MKCFMNIFPRFLNLKFIALQHETNKIPIRLAKLLVERPLTKNVQFKGQPINEKVTGSNWAQSIGLIKTYILKKN